MKQEMQTALEAVKEVMIKDYMRFMPENERMQTEFIEGLQWTEGQKYIKILQRNSVWGFVVATEGDKKFKYGDILKAAGWAAPARNAARGNVFTDLSWVQWTGPAYLKQFLTFAQECAIIVFD